VGLPVAHVGFALGAAALIGLAAGIPVGHLADRRGPREVFRLAIVVQALAVAALVFVRSVPSLIAVLCVAELATAAGQAARGPLIRALGAPNPTRYRSYLRALNNIAARQIEEYFVAVVDAVEIDPARASQPDDIRAWQWWSLHEMRETAQTIYPLGLAKLIIDYLRSGPPATPIELAG
jgi:hypothetical protein